MPTIQQTLAAATSRLAAEDFDTPRLDAEVLLRHVLQVSRAGLFMRYPDFMPEDAAQAYDDLIDQRLNRMPVAYLVGEKEFMGHTFRLTRDVLIPRPDTEPLVEWAISWASNRSGCRVVDIGTGSGAIGISVAAALPLDYDWSVTLTDVSPAALEVARTNARAILEGERLSRLTLTTGDLAAPLTEPVDLLLANLPYLRADQIAENPFLAPEPVLALDGGDAGMELIDRLIEDLPRVLSANGAAGFEIDPSQTGLTVASLANVYPERRTQVIQDLSHRERHVILLPDHTNDAVTPPAGENPAVR